MLVLIFVETLPGLSNKANDVNFDFRSNFTVPGLSNKANDVHFDFRSKFTWAI